MRTLEPTEPGGAVASPPAAEVAARPSARLTVLAIAAVLVVGGAIAAVLGPSLHELARPLGAVALIAGGLIAAVAVAPRGTVYARRTGREGQRAVDRVLVPLETEGWHVLRDRSIAGSPTVVDAVVVGRGGVFVVGTRRYRGRISVRAGELRVNGRRSPVADELRLAGGAVSRALAMAGVAGIGPVVACLCVERVDLPPLASEVGGIRVVDPPGLVGLLRDAPPRIDDERVEEIAAALDRALPRGSG